MTMERVMTRMRRLIGDAVDPYRWPDPDLLTAMHSAAVTLAGDHPDSRYVTSTNPEPLPDSLSATGAVPFVETYVAAWVYLSAYNVLSDYAEAAADRSQAGDFYQLYEREVSSR